MSSGGPNTNKQNCGCCTGVERVTPQVIANRPSLPAISYRVGTYPTFLSSMLAALSGSDVPALANLSTRSNSDFSIALIDAWAEALDVLTFYTERLANEAYLDTAIEARSVFELSRLVGFKPSPGASASTVVAYSLAIAPGSPTVVTIPAGSRVQSVPGPGQTPAVFETATDLAATIANNAIPAATILPWQLFGDDVSTWIAGTSNNIQVGDALLFVQPLTFDVNIKNLVQSGLTFDSAAIAKIDLSHITGASAGAAPRKLMVKRRVTTGSNAGGATNVNATSGVQGFSGLTESGLIIDLPPSGGGSTSTSSSASNSAPTAAVVYVTAVTMDPTSGNTMISWDQQLPFGSGAIPLALFAMRSKAALFGVNAPVPGMFANTTLKSIPPYHGDAPTNPGDWPWSYAGGQVINLDNAYAGLNPSAAQAQWMILTGPSTDANYSQYTSIFQVSKATESNPHLYGLSAKTSQLELSSYQILSGASWLSFAKLLSLFVSETRTTTAYVGSQPMTFADLPLTQWPLSTTYTLAAGMLAPTSGTSVLLAGAQPIAANAPVAVSGKRARIAPLVGLNGGNGGFTPTGSVNALPVSANQAFLVDAFPPQADPDIAGSLLWSVLTTSGQGTTQGAAPVGQPSTPTGQPGVLSAPGDPSQFQLMPALRGDPVAAEAAIVFSATVNGATTTLNLTNALQRIYDTVTVSVNANAVAATHGETVMEILGSGDATNAMLQFQLKQSPLTYTAAATDGGVQSTLQVRVNNLLWTEVPNFLSSGPADRSYVTTPVSGAGPIVQIGDGVQGARTATGVSNVQALYRKGIGSAGMVAPGQLTIPLDRPQGVQNVTNPSAATGGADPTSAAAAKFSAPLPTLTLGRIVSLEDYQNYALNFAGVALALASWTWFGAQRGVFLTLAGAGGSPLDAGDQTVIYLMRAYQNFGLPNVRVLPVSYTPQNFEIAMQVKVDAPTYVQDQVIAQVWSNLVAAFSFGQLPPGGGVAASQAVEIAQNLPGVIAVNLTGFNLSGAGRSLRNVLRASGPVPAGASGAPAQGAGVLLLDPASQGNVTAWT
jgi:hypothetical protein